MFGHYSFALDSFLHIKKYLAKLSKCSKIIKVNIYNSGEKVKGTRGYWGEEVAEYKTIFS